MAKYRINELSGGVVDTEDNIDIPGDDRNTDWLKYKDWVMAGNVADPAPAPYVETAEDLLNAGDRDMIRAIDWLLQYLVGNGTIQLSDIPPALRELYLRRKTLRGQ